jgi:hypothetical protein
MAVLRLRPGQGVVISGIAFTILRKLQSQNWQLENHATGELRSLPETELLTLFSRGDLTFSVNNTASYSLDRKLADKLERDLSIFPAEVIARAQQRLCYLRAIEDAQPIPMTPSMVCPVIATVAGVLGTPIRLAFLPYIEVTANGLQQPRTYVPLFPTSLVAEIEISVGRQKFRR